MLSSTIYKQLLAVGKYVLLAIMVVARMVIRQSNIAPIQVVIEVETVEMVNQLYASGEWCKPHYSEKRDKYIMFKRKEAI